MIPGEFDIAFEVVGKPGTLHMTTVAALQRRWATPASTYPIAINDFVVEVDQDVRDFVMSLVPGEGRTKVTIIEGSNMLVGGLDGVYTLPRVRSTVNSAREQRADAAAMAFRTHAWGGRTVTDEDGMSMELGNMDLRIPKEHAQRFVPGYTFAYE